MLPIRQILVLPFLAIAVSAQDADGDGLSDFHEVHKYRTDPNNADSDGDGLPDGNWLERREYQYFVRSVVQVMRPVTPEYLNDDYQDARVLDETDSYVELEVIHYPFNSVADAIKGNANWREDVAANADLAPWLAPGPTSDWTPELRETMLADLAAEVGIDIRASEIADAPSLDDRSVAETVSRWLMNRSEFHNGFTAFVTEFDEDGQPFVTDELRGNRDVEDFEAEWRRELSAAGMYAAREHGSCSSSSIYLSGCLRAIGLPTRTILCIPVVDAGDEREVDLVRHGIRHPAVRRTLLGALDGLRNSWASHTFNEVWIDGRWRRLNYSKLGQNIYDREMFGLMTHVATFRDWAEARMPETIGARQKGARQRDVFGGNNPYSTVALRDGFGPHCTLERPEHVVIETKVDRLWWSDDETLPEFIRAGMAPKGRFGLVAKVSTPQGDEALRAMLSDSDRRVYLNADDHRLGVGFDPGCAWFSGNGEAWFHIGFGRGDIQRLRKDTTYRIQVRNDSKDYAWKIAQACAEIRR